MNLRLSSDIRKPAADASPDAPTVVMLVDAFQGLNALKVFPNAKDSFIAAIKDGAIPDTFVNVRAGSAYVAEDGTTHQGRPSLVFAPPRVAADAKTNWAALLG